MSRARDLIDRFGREEDAFLKAEFIAPVARGGKIRIRIAGILCELEVPGAPEGWAVLRPVSHREAKVVAEPGLADVKRYLDLFPRARLVLALQYGERWFGLPAAAAEKGIDVRGLVPIALAKNASLFQTVTVRFDGALFLFESSERHAEAAWLGKALRRMSPPGALDRKGLSHAERRAYEIQYRWAQELAKSAEERRLESALALAGGRLVSFEERHGTFTVTYTVDGQAFQSVVTKKDLSVVSAGICLSGRDRDFDLASLVSVMRAQREGRR